MTESLSLDKNAGAGGVAQAVEHLPSKREALSSNPLQQKKKKELSTCQNH
jgi:hypothetical protein